MSMSITIKSNVEVLPYKFRKFVTFDISDPNLKTCENFPDYNIIHSGEYTIDGCSNLDYTLFPMLSSATFLTIVNTHNISIEKIFKNESLHFYHLNIFSCDSELFLLQSVIIKT